MSNEAEAGFFHLLGIKSRHISFNLSVEVMAHVVNPKFRVNNALMRTLRRHEQENAAAAPVPRAAWRAAPPDTMSGEQVASPRRRGSE